eukprot:9473160-Pyramimonas_sp.AAC.4
MKSPVVERLNKGLMSVSSPSGVDYRVASVDTGICPLPSREWSASQVYALSPPVSGPRRRYIPETGLELPCDNAGIPGMGG